MNLEERIYQDFVKALKDKDALKKNFLSYLRSELKNKAKSLKKESLDDKETIEILNKQKKKLEESQRLIAASQNEGLKEEIAQQLAILASYLPEPVSPQEIEKVVGEIISEFGFSSLKDMGSLMRQAIEKLGPGVDKALLSQIAKKKLS